MYLYVHAINVVVVTPECSPDKIERQIEDALSTKDNSIDARTDPDNRRCSPSVTVPDPPQWPVNGTKSDEAAYFTAYDTWRDEHFPRASALRMTLIGAGR